MAGEVLNSKAFYELMDVLKKHDKIDAFIKKHTLQEILFAFKGNGLGVNAYPDSKSYEIYLRLIRKIYSTDLTQGELAEIKKYEYDIKPFNALFDDYYNKNEFNEVIQVPDENKLFAFLIVFEIYVRALKDLRFNGGKNKDFYGDVDIQKSIKGKATGIDKLSANQLIDAIDYTLQQASKVVQAFIFHGYLYENNKFNCCGIEEEIEWADIEKSIQYFHLIDIRNVLFDALEDWKFGNYKLICNGQYTDIIPKDLKSFLDEKIEIQRFESYRQTNIRSNRDENVLIKQVSLTNSLAPDAFIDEWEKASYDEYLEYFSSDSLDYKVNGIELVKWLRAYAIVRYYNREFLNKNIFPDNGIPNSWLYITTRDHWIKMFIKHGIDRDSARFIYNKLKFKKSSVDWFDSPFIEIGENVITVPSLVSNLQDVIALTSMATKEDMNLDFKGYCYEDRILNDLRNNQIPAISIKRKVENDEYQCDVAFLLGNDLFLCECKHTTQPVTQRKRYDFYNKKIPEDVEQTNRICDFYSSNLIHVIDEFNKNQECNLATDWKPRRIYRMIIYSCKLARKLELDRVIITDYTVFTTLLYKRLPTIFEKGKPIKQIMPPKMKGVFQGGLTANKLLNFLENPWQIGFQKAATEIEDEVIPINHLFLCKKKAFRKIDNFYELGK
ncbi:hypothetical protein D0463_16035 [Bacillus sp. V59.32b]|nr:hypothetical protein D0463_16035 [Bacillus sp. V59.32b]